MTFNKITIVTTFLILLVFVFSSINNYFTNIFLVGGNLASTFLFNKFNYIDNEQNHSIYTWNKPIDNEKIDIVPFDSVVSIHYPGITDKYYTGSTVPSWEESKNHNDGVFYLTNVLKLKNAITSNQALLKPQYEPNHTLIMDATWNKFLIFDYHNVTHASNGDYGKYVLEDRMKKFNTTDILGLLVSESVLSMYLKYNDTNDMFFINLDYMSNYDPIDGFSRLGGIAYFKFDKFLQTQYIDYNNQTFIYNPNLNFNDYRYVEKAFIVSALAQTNLMTHVKLIHLELASIFQATTLNVFHNNNDHYWRKLLDQFIHRSIQVTNDNFELLYKYKSADFTLSQLDYSTQLRMVNDTINNDPISIQKLSMSKYALSHNMQKFTKKSNNQFFWTWYHRANSVQNIYKDLIKCILANHMPKRSYIIKDEMINKWFKTMQMYIPSFNQSISENNKFYKNNILTYDDLIETTSTLMLWVSLIHEDVGHSVSSFIYNPEYTPLVLLKDNFDIPIYIESIIITAYRSFVFLERNKLLDKPFDYWYDNDQDKYCFTDLQTKLKDLSINDNAFSNCGETGFYSCMQNVETSVSS